MNHNIDNPAASMERKLLALPDYRLALSEFYRVKWRRIRARSGSWTGRPIDPVSRVVMRINAELYAEARGWPVALMRAAQQRPRS